jgi:hypothetical protein
VDQPVLSTRSQNILLEGKYFVNPTSLSIARRSGVRKQREARGDPAS